MSENEPRIQVIETSRMNDENFVGKIEDIVANLQRLKENYGWEGIKKEWEMYATYPTYYLYTHRPETDREYENRIRRLNIKREKERKAKEKRRLQYEELKKEFEHDLMEEKSNG